jgi:lipopolysaccharide exporter
MSAEKGSLRARVFAGSLWLIILRIVSRVLSFAGTIILARLLMPEDFGLMAMAAISLAFLEAFTTLDLKTILIRDVRSGRPEYDTAWTLQIVRGTLIALLILIGAPAIAGFFDEPRLIAILPVVALALFVNGFHNIGMVDLEKEFQFQRIVFKESLTRVAMVLVQIVLAVVWRNYWALIAGIVCQSFVAVALSYYMSPYRPRLSFARFGVIFGFGKWLTASSIVYFLRDQCDALIIGRMLSSNVLGTYVVGRNLVHMPANELVLPVGRVMFPAYAKISGDPVALQRALLMMLATLFAVAAPACAGIGLVSEPLILGLFGEKWLPAAEIMPILAISAIMALTAGVFSQMTVVLGQPKLDVYTQLAALVVYVPVLIVGIEMAGAVGAAAARSAAAVVALLVIFLIVSRLMALRLRDVLAVVWRSAVALGVMVVVLLWVHGAGGLFGVAVAPIWLLVQLVLIGGGAYAGVLLALWLAQGKPDGAEEALLDMISGAIGQRRLAFLKRRVGSERP